MAALPQLSSPVEAPPKMRGPRRWLPRLPEIVFLSVLWWLLAGNGRVALLGDGDTGWHIRTGEWILEHRRFPTHDLFSYSKPGAEWFAWEWLSDVLLAAVHRPLGLGGVTLLAAVVIAGTCALLTAWLLWMRVNVLVAVVVMLAAGSAASVHWLARPHLFTYLFFVASLWTFEADRRRPGRRLWLLVPLAAVWTNLHGGFLALIGVALCYWTGALLAADRRLIRRYGLLAAAVAAATLANPYTWRLHAHIGRYLTSGFIRDNVMEFQSPRFRGESMLAFEVLLLAALILTASLWRRREYATALLLVGLAHAALGSVRHVVLFVLAAAPVVARELSERLETWPNAWARAAAAVGRTASGPDNYGPPVCALVSVALGAGLLASGLPSWRTPDFPKEKFPLAALAAAEKNHLGARMFTSDQWADHLIYRYWPRVRVFIDGRSDFYGPEIAAQYLETLTARHGWERVFAHYRFDVALLPAEWPLATVLKAHPGWRLEYDDGQALLLRRVTGSSAASAHPTTIPCGEKGH